MKTFGIRHEELLKTPMKRFWAYHKAADRLQAADDMRMLHLLAGVTSQEGFNKLQERLAEQIGEIYVFQPAAQSYDVDSTNENEPDPALERDKLEGLRASIVRHGR